MSTSPIFVVGPPRSGTTLTATILGRHSRIFMGGENHFFEEVFSRRRELGEPSDPVAFERILGRLSTIYGRHNQIADQERMDRLLSDPRLRARLQSCNSYPELLTRFMEMQFPGTGKVRWGNNTPKDIFHVREILSFYQDAKFLVCVRDVRDYLLSYKNQWKAKTPEQLERLQKLYHPMVTSLVWKSTIKRIRTVQRLVPRENFMIVRYETLATDAENTVRDMCRVVGEPYEANMLNVDTHNSSHEKSETGIFSTSIGAWRTGLDNDEAYLAQRMNQVELEQLGYQFEEIPVRFRDCAKFLLTFPAALRRALAANSRHRGPFLPYLNKRVKALLRGS